jgi:PAS domain S-box-containing protein
MVTRKKRKQHSRTTWINVPEEHEPGRQEKAAAPQGPKEARPTAGPSPTVKKLRRLVNGSVDQELLQNMYDGVLMVDHKGRMVEANFRAAKLLHCTQAELNKLNIIDVVCGADKSLLQQVRDSLKAERHVLLDTFCKRLDGSIFPAEIAVTGLHLTKEGQLCFFIRDITERKQDEEALARERDLLQSLMNNIPDRIYFKDAESRFLRINRALATRLALNHPDEAIGKTDFDFYEEDQAREFYEDDQLVILNGTPILDKEQRVRNRDGTYRWSSITKVPIRDEQNRIVGLVGINRDITDRVRAEQELKSAHAQVERVKRLEATSLFAGQIAHDLNNLLVPLLVYPGMIKKQLEESSQAYKDLSIMENTASQMADINQDLLALSRRGNVKQAILNVNDAVEEVMQSFVRTNVPAGVEAECVAAAELPNVRFGPPQLVRVLQNLCQNAVDAMGGEGRLTVGTENAYLDKSFGNYVRVNRGEYVKITVSDTGPGIPEDVRDKIFDPFFTTKTNRSQRGSGLGLSVVYGIVRDHKGYIDLETEVGKGTTFSLYFPVCREQTEQERARVATRGGSERILVVDDDPIQVEVLGRILSELGYKVMTGHTGEEAARMFEERARKQKAEQKGLAPHEIDFPDLVVMDMILGAGIDGAEAYRRILEIRPSQRALTISGYKDSDRVAAAQALGAGPHLCKPITFEGIAAAVREELDRE